MPNPSSCRGRRRRGRRCRSREDTGSTTSMVWRRARPRTSINSTAAIRGLPKMAEMAAADPLAAMTPDIWALSPASVRCTARRASPPPQRNQRRLRTHHRAEDQARPGAEHDARHVAGWGRAAAEPVGGDVSAVTGRCRAVECDEDAGQAERQDRPPRRGTWSKPSSAGRVCQTTCSQLVHGDQEAERDHGQRDADRPRRAGASGSPGCAAPCPPGHRRPGTPWSRADSTGTSPVRGPLMTGRRAAPRGRRTAPAGVLAARVPGAAPDRMGAARVHLHLMDPAPAGRGRDRAGGDDRASSPGRAGRSHRLGGGRARDPVRPGPRHAAGPVLRVRRRFPARSGRWSRRRGSRPRSGPCSPG